MSAKIGSNNGPTLKENDIYLVLVITSVPVAARAVLILYRVVANIGVQVGTARGSLLFLDSLFVGFVVFFFFPAFLIDCHLV